MEGSSKRVQASASVKARVGGNRRGGVYERVGPYLDPSGIILNGHVHGLGARMIPNSGVLVLLSSENVVVAPARERSVRVRVIYCAQKTLGRCAELAGGLAFCVALLALR